MVLTSPQTRPIDLPADSNFAVALRNQQAAEREEQQRIKNLVLNYDLNDDQTDGEPPSFHYVYDSNRKQSSLTGTGALNRACKPSGRYSTFGHARQERRHA